MFYRIRIGKIRHQLFTSVQHQHYAGFFGFLLTISPTFTNTSSAFTVYCPSLFRSIAKIYDDFLYHAKNIQINYRFVDQFEDDDDEEELKKFEKMKEVNELNNSNNNSNINGKILLDDIDLTLRSIPIFRSTTTISHNSTLTPDISVAYLFRLKDKPGQLLLQKCR